MIKTLPINSMPLIRSYPTYSFVEAIANNEDTCGSKIISIEVNDYQKTKWQTSIKGMDFREDKNEIDISLDPYTAGATSHIYRKCRQTDELVIKINHQISANPWVAICLFVDTAEKCRLGNSTLYKYRMGKFPRLGFYVDHPFETYSYIKGQYVTETPCWLKISIYGSKISFCYAQEEGIWQTLSSCEFDSQLDENSLCIGFCYDYDGNQYHDWLFSNFIQISGGTTGAGLPVQYTAYPDKAFNLYPICPFITMLPERKSMLQVYGFSLWEYIEICINEKRYVELNVDEYYLPGTRSYNSRHFMHGNLVYGYNKTTSEVYILSYVNGKPKPLLVPYLDLLNAFNAGDFEFIYVYEHYKSPTEYRMNVERICHMLQCYLQGSGYHDIGLGFSSEPKNAVYGIGLYDDYVKDHTSIDIFLNDIRIAYILREHKMVMRERIKYLQARKVVSEVDIAEISDCIDEISSLSLRLENLVIKNSIKSLPGIYEKIIDYMTQIKNHELKAYSKLHNLLTSKLHYVKYRSLSPFGSFVAISNYAPVISGNLLLCGSDIVFTAIPKPGYKICEWKRQGEIIPSYTANTLEIRNLSTDECITVDFVQIDDSL